MLGARVDHYRFDVESDQPAELRPRQRHDRQSEASASIFGPWARTEFYLNAGGGFHSNDARGTTISVDPATGTGTDAGRAGVPVTPLVRSRGGEVGRAHRDRCPACRPRWPLCALDLDSELLFVGDAGTTEPSRPSRRQGVEWNTRWRPIPWLLLDLDVAWTKARFTDDDPAGKRIPGAIETAVSAGATIQQLGPWSASVFLRYFGARPLIEDNSVRSTSSTIVNAQVGYRVTRDLLVGLEAFNLFDAEVDDIAYYYASRLPGEPPGSMNDVHFHPAESRSFRATLRYSF